MTDLIPKTIEESTALARQQLQSYQDLMIVHREKMYERINLEREEHKQRLYDIETRFHAATDPIARMIDALTRCLVDVPATQPHYVVVLKKSD